MTNNPRATLMLTPELDEAIMELRKSDRFCRCSISEIIRVLIEKGLEAQKKGD